MSTTTITALPTAGGIDGAADFLAIDTASPSATNKISRNILLGITSQPLGLTDTQSPTNKTLGNTNTVTLKDTLFTLQDDSDTTKQARFQLSGITTATTRTYTLPNVTDTLVSLTASQTLTNKTLTSPAITGGTYDNGSITVDSIAGHSTSTIVTVANLQISNGVLNTANAVTATSIAASAVTPNALATGTGSGWAWSTWVPTWVNLTPGNAVTNYRYIQMGKTVFFQLVLTFGNTTAITGAPTISLPTTPSSNYIANSPNGSYIGEACYLNASTAVYNGRCRLVTSTTIQLETFTTSSTNVVQSDVSASVPFSFTNGSRIFIYGFYETT